MAICQVCGKGRMIGRNIRHKHAGLWERKAPKTPRVFLPNIQKKTLKVNGEVKKIKICTKCLKRVKKEGSWRGLSLNRKSEIRISKSETSTN